jgi:hypothetical protein
MLDNGVTSQDHRLGRQAWRRVVQSFWQRGWSNRAGNRHCHCLRPYWQRSGSVKGPKCFFSGVTVAHVSRRCNTLSKRCSLSVRPQQTWFCSDHTQCSKDDAGTRESCRRYGPGRRRVRSGSANLAVTIARWLVDLRLADQACIAGGLLIDPDAAETIAGWRRAVVGATDSDTLLRAEGRAADRSWAAWRDVELRSSNRDHGRVPAHFLGFGGRRSSLLFANNWSNRRATDPINALINLGAKAAETEACGR